MTAVGTFLEAQRFRGLQVHDELEFLRDQLHQQVEEWIKRGARRVLGGEIPAGRGAFYPPALLTAVDKRMPAFDEETFGPVAAGIRARMHSAPTRIPPSPSS